MYDRSSPVTGSMIWYSSSMPRVSEGAFMGAGLGAGCWVLGAGCWVLGAGCWVLGAGCWVLGAVGIRPFSTQHPAPSTPAAFYCLLTPPSSRPVTIFALLCDDPVYAHRVA